MMITQHRPPASMFPVSKTNKKRAENAIQDTRGKNVKNVSVENLSCNDILYNLIKQFASKDARVRAVLVRRLLF